MARYVVLPLVLLLVACPPAGAGTAGTASVGTDSASSGSAPTTGEPAGTPWARNVPIELDRIAVRDSGEIVVSGRCYDRAIDGSQLSPPESYGLCFAAVGPQGEIHWSRRFGGPTTSYAGGQSIAAGPDGGVFITGTFDSTIDLGGGPLIASGGGNVYLASFDADGDHRWSRRFAGDCPGLPYSCAWGFGVTTDPAGNVIAVGKMWFPADLGGGQLGEGLFVASYDADGNHRWSKSFAGAMPDQSGRGSSIATDAAGNLYLGGIIEGTVDFGGGPLAPSLGDGAPEPVFIASLDADGGHRWSRRFVPDGQPNVGDTIPDHQIGENLEVRALAVDPAGNVYFTGVLAGTIDFGGGELQSVGSMPAGTSVFLYANTYLASLDSAGAHRWSKRFGDGAGNMGRAVACDPAGNLMLTGVVQQPTEDSGIDLGGGPLTNHGIYVASFTPDGAHRWSVAYGDPFSGTWTIASDAVDAVYLAGMGSQQFGELSVPSTNPFLAYLSPAGP